MDIQQQLKGLRQQLLFQQQQKQHLLQHQGPAKGEEAISGQLLNELMQQLDNMEWQLDAMATTSACEVGQNQDAAGMPPGYLPSTVPARLPPGLQRPGSIPKDVAKNIVPGGAKVPGKPMRQKVNSKDLSKLDIVPEMVTSGEDTRTTVMIRNIPKFCSRDQFVELLDQCGLQGRYSFFYMPFDKRRNSHCGFAFVHFRAPQDVLNIHGNIQGALAQRCPSSGATSAPPVLSYARLQGEQQLARHFSLSAVMSDSDARRRPLFLGGCEDQVDHIELGTPAKVNLNAKMGGRGSPMSGLSCSEPDEEQLPDSVLGA